MKIQADYYQQFDADYTRDVPAEGYGGWKSAPIEVARQHTAVVVMHAWDCGSFDDAPGSWRACEYLQRSQHICATILPRLLTAVRDSGLTLFHVVGRKGYYEHLPGYQRAAALASRLNIPPRPSLRLDSDPVLDELWKFHHDHVWPGAQNTRDRARERGVTFPPQALPQSDEGIASNSEELFALCQARQINHLVYTGFAIGGCLLTSPGGMLDMLRYGAMCSTIREAVTAIENRETARQELAKQLELWRVALTFGFVFGAEEFTAALIAPA